MDLEQTLEAFFRDHAPLAGGDTMLIAFSGGADSTALLDAMCAYARPRAIRVAAAHIDHQLDPGSRARAEAAKTTAATLGLALTIHRQNVPAQKRRSESLEVAARRIRYRELEKAASVLGARYIATAHHRDDQAETVLLRLASGHGLSALAAVPARRGSIVRPLLGQSRKDLLRYVRRRGLTWIEDPTNRDLTTPRNRLRHLLIPILGAKNPDIAIRLASLAQAAKGANTRLTREFDQLLAPSREGSAVTVSRRVLETLPTTVLPTQSSTCSGAAAVAAGPHEGLSAMQRPSWPRRLRWESTSEADGASKKLEPASSAFSKPPSLRRFSLMI